MLDALDIYLIYTPWYSPNISQRDPLELIFPMSLACFQQCYMVALFAERLQDSGGDTGVYRGLQDVPPIQVERKVLET